jgi:hypothetical protein
MVDPEGDSSKWCQSASLCMRSSGVSLQLPSFQSAEIFSSFVDLASDRPLTDLKAWPDALADQRSLYEPASHERQRPGAADRGDRRWVQPTCSSPSLNTRSHRGKPYRVLAFPMYNRLYNRLNKYSTQLFGPSSPWYPTLPLLGEPPSRRRPSALPAGPNGSEGGSHAGLSESSDPTRALPCQPGRSHAASQSQPKAVRRRSQ